MTPLQLLDYAGVALFAATGALAASRKELDVIGFVFFAAITGMGGGTLRDLVLDRAVFWTVNPNYILVCAGVAVGVFFTAPMFESRYRILLWLDAVGLAAYSVLGAALGLAATGSPVIAMVTGMMTATVGGIIRDVLAGEPSVLLRPEVYVTAALVGAGTFTAAEMAGLERVISVSIAVLAAFLVRGGALKFGWSFPRYKSRPGRPPEELE